MAEPPQQATTEGRARSGLVVVVVGALVRGDAAGRGRRPTIRAVLGDAARSSGDGWLLEAGSIPARPALPARG
jgi:hypothetical protein